MYSTFGVCESDWLYLVALGMVWLTVRYPLIVWRRWEMTLLDWIDVYMPKKSNGLVL